jgi:hypothetical protein
MFDSSNIDAVASTPENHGGEIFFRCAKRQLI